MGERLARRVKSSSKLSPALREELDGRPWQHPWVIEAGGAVRLADPAAARIDASRREMLEPRLPGLIADRAPGVTGLDLSCGEGLHSMRLLEWGAERVLAIDDRGAELARARLLVDELGVDRDRIELREATVSELRPSRLGEFDVVLAFDLLERVRDPLGALRLARGCARAVAVIESRLSASLFAPAAITLETSSVGELLYVPTREAVETLALAAGFSKVETLRPPVLGDPAFVEGDRGLFLAHV